MLFIKKSILLFCWLVSCLFMLAQTDSDNDGILDSDENISCETFNNIAFDPIPNNGDIQAPFVLADGTEGYYQFVLTDPNYAANGIPEFLFGDNYIRAIRGHGLGGITKVIFPNTIQDFKMAVANIHGNGTNATGTNGSLDESQNIKFYYNGQQLDITPVNVTNGGIFDNGNLYPGTANAIDQATFVFEIYQPIDSIINTSIGTLDHTSVRINGKCVSDSDGDGIPNIQDDDSDNDGITDGEDGLGDCNNNGIPNFADPALCPETVELIIPNAFSPNGDNHNEYWMIRGIEALPDNEIIIFNRWGNKVYEASPYLNNWNGTSDNGWGSDILPDGTYFYILKSNHNLVSDKKGWVQLKSNTNSN